MWTQKWTFILTLKISNVEVRGNLNFLFSTSLFIKHRTLYYLDRSYDCNLNIVSDSRIWTINHVIYKIFYLILLPGHRKKIIHVESRRRGLWDCPKSPRRRCWHHNFCFWEFWCEIVVEIGVNKLPKNQYKLYENHITIFWTFRSFNDSWRFSSSRKQIQMISWINFLLNVLLESRNELWT